MCASVSYGSEVRGAGKGAGGWFGLSDVTVAWDHPVALGAEHAVLIDFSNYSLGTGARVAVELDIESARSLMERLGAAVAAAEVATAANPSGGGSLR